VSSKKREHSPNYTLINAVRVALGKDPISRNGKGLPQVPSPNTSFFRTLGDGNRRVSRKRGSQ
jgi:hypothetical protein